MNRDIWTIVFDNDQEIFLLKKQIESLIYFKNPLPYNIIINEFDSDFTRKKLKNTGILSLLKTANFKTSIYDMRDIVDPKYLHQSQGYVNQQILKLQVYTKSPCNEHLILDAKNIVSSPNIFNNFHPKGHTPPLNFFGCFDVFNQRWHKGKIKTVRPFTTPYLFKKHILLALQNSFKSTDRYFKILSSVSYEPTSKEMKRLDKRANPRNKVACISEFYIYNLFEQRYDRNYKEYTGPGMNVKWLFLADDLLENTEDFDIISVHRKTVEQLGFEAIDDAVNRMIYKNGPN